MDKKEFIELSNKLDVLINLLSYQIISNKSLTEGAPILRRLGVSASDIAAVFDTTTNTVSVRLAESKKKPKNSITKK